MYIVWNVIAAILLCAAITFLIILIADLCIMGAPLLILARKARIPEYLISTPNRIDAQEGLQCAGYSSAYLLRHFGQRAQGAELYAFAPCKQADGVTPRGLRKLLISRGMCVSYRMGNLNALKNTVAQGAPVIVIIKVRPDKPWLHYVPVVGYDKEHIYLAESLAEYANASHPAYNRVLDNTQFLRLWNTAAFKMPLHRHIFFVAAPRKNK